MARYVVLDTDVSSQSFRNRLPAPLVTRLAGMYPCITFVTLAELAKWVEIRRWGRPTEPGWITGCPVSAMSRTSRRYLEPGDGSR